MIASVSFLRQAACLCGSSVGNQGSQAWEETVDRGRGQSMWIPQARGGSLALKEPLDLVLTGDTDFVEE